MALGRHDRSIRQIDANDAVARRLVEVTTMRAAQGRWDAAAGWARVAASFSVSNPTGWLRSMELEQALDVLADVVPPAISSTTRGGVLHVVSEVHAIGGHRSMLQRWLQADAQLGLTADLAVTRAHPVPTSLVDATLQTGGCVTVLGRHRPMARAARLRALAAHHDVVVCHTHADDPIPAIAFGSRWSSTSGVPVVMVDHSDHLFWLAAGSMDTLVTLREPGTRAAVELRGVNRQRIRGLPIPIEIPEPRRTHHEGVALIAVARPQKFAAMDGQMSFPDVVVPALGRLPQARLMVVGPEPSDPVWAGARASLGERLWLTGMQEDPATWRARGDIHLDPIPFGSATSLLESAAFGLPAIALRSATPHQSLLSSAGVLDHGLVWAANPHEYVEELITLVRDDDYRRSLGEAARRCVEQTNGTHHWVDALRRFYDVVQVAGTNGVDITQPVRDVNYACALLGVESSAPLQWIMSSATPDFDASDRALATGRLARARLMRRLHGHPQAVAGADADVLIPDAEARR